MKPVLKHIKRYLGIVLFLGVVVPVYSQQDPMYTQYMFNTQTINPAYAGTWESVGFMAISRMQWVGIETAPSTQTFSFQMPLKNERVGVGANIINDRIGLERRFSLNLDYSYKIVFDGFANLRMGLKAGFSNYTNNLSDYTLYDEATDPAFTGVIEPKFIPNAGIGFLVENPHFSVGISMPKLLSSPVESSDGSFALQGELRHLFLTAGYVYSVNNNIKLKPTILVKAVSGAPLQADFSANVLLKEQFWLGAMYRTGSSYGFIAQWIFDKKLRIGYAVDFSLTGLSGYQYGSHEIMISYELKFLKRDVISPRYF